MPTYNYRCLSCSKEFVVFQSMNEKSVSNCKLCNSEKIEKLISAGSGLIFKGSGFYLTDYKNSKNNENSNNKKLVTMTAVRPPARFGALKFKGHLVSYFKEKSRLDEGWINGGFFVMEPEFLKYIKNDNTFLEREPLEMVTRKKQLVAFKHEGFWQCMDTKRDKDNLNKILIGKKIKF